MHELVIIGAGGLAREVLWVAREMNRQRPVFEPLGFIDDDAASHGKTLSDLPVLGGFDWLERNASPGLRVVCGIGNTQARKAAHDRAAGLGLTFANVIDPTARYSAHVELGEGVVITAGCVVTTQIELHDGVFLNLLCTVGHDTIMEAYTNCAPGCNISGDVHLERGVQVGTGAKIIQGLRVGAWTTVGAGAVVVKDVPPLSVAVGVPARVIKTKENAPE